MIFEVAGHTPAQTLLLYADLTQIAEQAVVRLRLWNLPGA